MSSSEQGSTWAAYRRLLGTVRPYSGRLIIGILAGLLCGGSLWGILSMAPRLLEPFENGGKVVESGRLSQPSLPAPESASPATPVKDKNADYIRKLQKKAEK